MAARQPLQFSLRTLILITIVSAAALAIAGDIRLFVRNAEDAFFHRSFGPMVGWLAITGLLWRKDLGDLHFIRGLMPGLALAIIAIIAVGSMIESPAPGFSDEFPMFAYWLLYVACVLGEGAGFCYGLWLWIVGDLTAAFDSGPIPRTKIGR